MKVQNIPKQLVKKHHKIKPITPILHPQLFWLKDYQNIPNSNQNSQNKPQNYHPVKKLPTKLFIKNQNKFICINNQNFNIDNFIIFHKISNTQTISPNNLTDSQPTKPPRQKPDPYLKKHSCQLLPPQKKSTLNFHNRSYLLKLSKPTDPNQIDPPIDPWQIDDKTQQDILHFQMI